MTLTKLDIEPAESRDVNVDSDIVNSKCVMPDIQDYSKISYPSLVDQMKESNEENKEITKCTKKDEKKEIGELLTSKVIYGINQSKNNLLLGGIKEHKLVTIPFDCSSSEYVQIEEGKILIAGGVDERGLKTNLCRTCDLTLGSFNTAASMEIPKIDHVLVLVLDKVFCLGGMTGDNSEETEINDTEVYSVKEKKWMQGPNLRLKARKLAAVCLDNVLYAFGGICCSYPLNSIQILKSDAWESLKISVYEEMKWTVALPFHGKILLFGGQELHEFNPETTELINKKISGLESVEIDKNSVKCYNDSLIYVVGTGSNELHILSNWEWIVKSDEEWFSKPEELEATVIEA